MPITYQEALTIIQTAIQPLHHTQTLPLLKALHRICATQVHAAFALPKHSMSLKEGYGLALCDPKQSLYPLQDAIETVQNGQAVRLFTGDAIPEGIDTVVAEEDVVLHTDRNAIELHNHPCAAQHIKHQGEDIAQGEILLRRFERIGAYKITALSSQGIHRLKVLKKPRVTIISIGNALASGDVANSNAMSLAARIIELGGKVEAIVTCEEDTQTILSHLQTAVKTADFIITTGALSQKDAMRTLLNQSTLHTLFHEVKIAPAKPSALTLLNQKPILHLPGLPLSCMLGFEMLGVALLRHLQHYACVLPEFITCINQKRFTCRKDCMSAIPGYSDGKNFIHAPFYEAGRLNILSQCNGYMLIEGQEVIEEGEEIAFFYF
jgi:molybdopterin molybdotransferase